jgi:membrane associated rhomboid family serine protease
VTGPPGTSGTPGPGTQSGIPTCYRHPGRETYVSCVRCGRPACPDCLRSAAVGQQCVDCIREASRGTRQPSGAFGGRVVVSGAPVTWTLVGINVLLFLVELVHSSIGLSWAMLGGVISNGQVIGVVGGQWYRLITSAFLPPPGLGSGLLDIAFNMWALIFVGPAIERLLGHLRYLAVYLVSAVAGGVMFYYLAPLNEPALGASGAIFGLFGAWFVLARRLRMDARPVVMLIVLNLVISFTVPDIAWQDHLGGLIAGTALTAAFAYAPRRNRALIQVGATVALIAIMFLAVVLRDENLVHEVLF